MESVLHQKCAFWRSQPTRYQHLQMGEPKPEILGFHELILPILSDVEKFTEFNSETISNPSKSGGDIARKLHAWVASGQTKNTFDRKLFCSMTI